jgi:hypothetical protein
MHLKRKKNTIQHYCYGFSFMSENYILQVIQTAKNILSFCLIAMPAKRSHFLKSTLKCDVFGKAFSELSHFKDHIRIHTGGGKKPLLMRCLLEGVQSVMELSEAHKNTYW